MEEDAVEVAEVEVVEVMRVVTIYISLSPAPHPFCIAVGFECRYLSQIAVPIF